MENLSHLSTALDAWYRGSARDLPWRIGPGDRDAGVLPDPYRVWVSEVMLQQTTVAHVSSYFARFIARWPSVQDLASAPWEDVSSAWAGLGYYSRARNLHAGAQAIVEAGGFPEAPSALRGLPGIGPYTAAAIAAIAFDQRCAPVDGNIERVVSRLFAIGSDRTEAGWRLSKKQIAAKAQALFDQASVDVRPGDLAQALMDLGASICTPTTPACKSCPLAGSCQAFTAGKPEQYPEKPDKAARPIRFGAAFVACKQNSVWLVRRPTSGLLGGMLMPPSSDWAEQPADDLLLAAPIASAPKTAEWERIGEVRHIFTHFALRLEVWRASLEAIEGEGAWTDLETAMASLPTVGRKAVALATASHPIKPGS